MLDIKYIKNKYSINLIQEDDFAYCVNDIQDIEISKLQKDTLLDGCTLIIDNKNKKYYKDTYDNNIMVSRLYYIIDKNCDDVEFYYKRLRDKGYNLTFVNCKSFNNNDFIL